MARLTRKNIKVFAGNASNNGVFGSLQENNPVLTNDVEQLQSLDAWNEGWNAATKTSEELPPLEEIQGVEYVTTYQQAYIMQEGLPEWAATVTYYKGSLIKEVTPNGFRIYCSLTDDNIGNIISDTANWKKVMDSEDLYAFDNTVVHKASAETITGVKTFSASPLVPNVSSGDSSTKAANTAFVTSAANSLQTQINQKANTSAVVTLTGAQTITGKKSFASNICIQKNGITKGTNPSSINHVTLELTDKNGSGSENRIGAFESSVSPDGLVSTEISAYNYVSGSTSRSRIAVFQPKTGVPYTYAPASDAISSILTTVNKSKAADGYFQLGNGLIINWGQRTSGEAAQTITFSRPFISTNYFFCATWKSAKNASAIFCTTSKTTTNCNITKLNYSGTSTGGGSDYTWFAIGY